MSSLSTVILLFIVIVFINAEKICPGYGYVLQSENCTSTCSPSNDRCSAGLKCCYHPTTPCGFHCVISKDNVQKAGVCPTLQANNPLWFVCDSHDCDVDKDCRDTSKCCTNICGSKVCVAP